MERLYSEAECLLCNIQKNCLSFPCRHSVCNKCYLDHYKPRIRQLEKMIMQNVEKYNGKSTCLGCVYRCEESLLTMDPSVLCRMFRENNDENSASLIEKYRHFFLGIPSYFLKCEYCKTVHVQIRPIEFCPVAREIYEPKFNETVSGLINSYNMSPFSYFLSSFVNYETNVTEEYKEHLVFLNESKSLHLLQLSPLKIFKLSNANLRTHYYFALVSIKIIKEDNIFVFVNKVEDCIIKAIYKIERTENLASLIKRQPSNDSVLLSQIMTKLDLKFGYTFIKNTDQVYANNELVESQGSDFIFMISPNFDVYAEKYQEEWLKIYIYCSEYAKPGVLISLAKAITIEQKENYIIVSGFDMISCSKIYKLT